MKKKAVVKIRKAKVRKVVTLAPDKHLIVADDVELEVHGASAVPVEPPPDEPIVFDDHTEAVAETPGTWKTFFKSFW